MASAWGASWGSAWGNSWGSIETESASGGGGGRLIRKREKWQTLPVSDIPYFSGPQPRPASNDEVVKLTEIEIRQALAPVVELFKVSLPNVDSDEILEGLIRFEDFEQRAKEQDRLRQQKINNAAAMLIILMSST